MTHYETLGVPSDATPAQIKAAFRKLASQHHPDREGGDAQKSAAVNDAYAVLSDAERRARYDAGERDARPPTAEEQHELRVLMMLNAAMNDALDEPMTETLGIVSTVRKALRTAAKNAKDGSAKAMADAARLERMKAKVQRKAAAGHDIVSELIDGRISKIRDLAAQATKESRELTDALARLDDYLEDAPSNASASSAMQSQIDQMALMMNVFGGRGRF